jgi:hypothetical protein
VSDSAAALSPLRDTLLLHPPIPHPSIPTHQPTCLHVKRPCVPVPCMPVLNYTCLDPFVSTFTTPDPCIPCLPAAHPPAPPAPPPPNSLTPEGVEDKASLHGSCPTTKGEKWSATK